MRKVFFMLLFCFSIASAVEPFYSFKSDSQAKQFSRLTKTFRCLVCQNEDLADSNAPLAKDLRDKIYRLVLLGKSDKQIKIYMTQRYGLFVLFDPPFQMNTYLLWLAPFLFLFVGVLVLYSILRKR